MTLTSAKRFLVNLEDIAWFNPTPRFAKRFKNGLKRDHEE